MGDFFEIKTGVLQGDTLAPFLFIIMIDYVMRTALDKLSIEGVDDNVFNIPAACPILIYLYQYPSPFTNRLFCFY